MTGPLTVHRLATMDPETRRRLVARSTAAIFDEELARGIRQLIDDVRREGDVAVARALARFDGVDCPPDRLRVTQDEMDAAADAVPDELVRAVRHGIANIRAYCERILADVSWRQEIAPGIEVGEQARPIISAGLFVPSGKGSFPSVLMHIGTPAVVAGVPRIAVIVPPKAGCGLEVDPAVLLVASELGIEDVFRANGPAGIAALAIGTDTIPRVAKVVGPGSPAVTAAQIQVQLLGCSTEMLFGPSESLVIADDSADPILLAADLLTEAEHGVDSAVLLVTSSERLVTAVQGELRERLAELPEPRRTFAAAALSDLGGAVLVDDAGDACSFANDYAPEHLQIATVDPDATLAAIDHAGEILLGQTPFALANYILGIPNTLPTGGFARVSSGVSVRAFLKLSSIGRVSPDAAVRLSPAALALADHESFPAHAAAIRSRGRPAGSA